MRFVIRILTHVLRIINILLKKLIENRKYDVVLTSCGVEKIKVINEIRKITGFGLAQAKLTVESCPFLIKTGISKENAEAIKERLTAVGATVEIN